MFMLGRVLSSVLYAEGEETIIVYARIHRTFLFEL